MVSINYLVFDVKGNLSFSETNRNLIPGMDFTCKDLLRTNFWKRAVGLDASAELEAPAVTESALLDEVMKLPKNYRASIYLYYYEGYTVKEIAAMLGKSENAISAYLSRGRKKLKLQLLPSGVERRSDYVTDV